MWRWLGSGFHADCHEPKALRVPQVQALYGITPTDFVVVWASPPCQAYSRLQISGATVAEGRVPSAARIEQNRRQADRAVAWTFMFCEYGALLPQICSLFDLEMPHISLASMAGEWLKSELFRQGSH